MAETDPRSRRVVVPGVRWLRFPRRLEAEYREYQCLEAVDSFRVNAFYILVLYLLLVTGIYALAPADVRGLWLGTYLWVGVIVMVAGILAQFRGLDRYFPLYTGVGSFLAVMLSMAIPGFLDEPGSVQLANVSVIYALVIVYAMVGLRFPLATLACWAGGMFGWLIAEQFGRGIDWQIAHRTYTGVSLLGMFLCYTEEVRGRLLFFNQRQLQRQQNRTQALAERLHRLSREDSLTGLANRRYFDEVLDREWRRCQRERVPLTVMLVDVDRFKAYNDHYGHLQGDECLRALAAELRSYSRRGGDMVARFGGEEFVLLYPGVDETEAARLASRLCRTVRGMGLRHEYNPPFGEVTISVGVAWTVPMENRSAIKLVDAADQALYQAKEGGRDGWRLYEPPPTVRLVRDIGKRRED
ncbi:GGDEF domain-containing protein [Alcanivorax sp. S6407]|uniref:GGDEF domain-containing protein n=1 Tax=Alcanivorax sp. S6407 TaxID=2926424 RepID=UPI001FF3D917|nr:GGDEF domain-containing protein [Alcanivorax sp. S6407]MCK0153497.1 GGDEF domain-containing protein [Alcanivorax sp. S6407]